MKSSLELLTILKTSSVIIVETLLCIELLTWVARLVENVGW